MKKAIALVLVFILAMSLLAGCAGGGGTLSGKYAVVSMKMGETDYIEMLKAGNVSTENIYLEFQEGGKFRLNMEIAGEDNSQEGTFTVAGNTATLTVGDKAMTATIDGNKITMEADGSTMVFAK